MYGRQHIAYGSELFRNGKRQFCHIWEGRKDRAQFIKNYSHGTLAYVMQKVLVMLIFFELSIVSRSAQEREKKGDNGELFMLSRACPQFSFL